MSGENEPEEAEQTVEESSDGSGRTARPDRVFSLGFLVFLVSNFLALLLMASRAGGPPEFFPYYDAALFLFLLAFPFYIVLRKFFSYPFRMSDLLIVILTLSLGLRLAISDGSGESVFGTIAQAWIATIFVLMLGAALGLHNCHTLKIETPLRRALALICGICVMPAAAMTVVIPALALMRAADSRAAPRQSALTLSVVWVLSAGVTWVNASLALRTVALKTQNADPQKSDEPN